MVSFLSYRISFVSSRRVAPAASTARLPTFRRSIHEPRFAARATLSADSRLRLAIDRTEARRNGSESPAVVDTPPPLGPVFTLNGGCGSHHRRFAAGVPLVQSEKHRNRSRGFTLHEGWERFAHRAALLIASVTNHPHVSTRLSLCTRGVRHRTGHCPRETVYDPFDGRSPGRVPTRVRSSNRIFERSSTRRNALPHRRL